MATIRIGPARMITSWSIMRPSNTILHHVALVEAPHERSDQQMPSIDHKEEEQ